MSKKRYPRRIRDRSGQADQAARPQGGRCICPARRQPAHLYQWIKTQLVPVGERQVQASQSDELRRLRAVPLTVCTRPDSADLDPQRVEEHHRVHRLQWARLPSRD